MPDSYVDKLGLDIGVSLLGQSILRVNVVEVGD